MKMRTATKIMHTRLSDPYRKPSEQTPYSDRQWVAAGRRWWAGLKSWKRVDPTMSSRPKWAKYAPSAPLASGPSR